MCGIAAVLLYPQERTAEQWQAILDIFTQNLVFNEERGQAATGVALTSADGRVWVYKQALPASKFVHMREYHEALSKIGPQTTLLLGHTRLPTKADPSINGNNHPIQAGPVIGVHNGHIDNDDELFSRCGCERTAEVDSEIIFRLIESINPAAMNGQYLDQVCPLIRVMQGQYTFMVSDSRKPEQLLVLKHRNPLCIHFHREWNALVFSSRYIFLRKAFGVALVAEALEHDQLMLFNAYT
ncbi:MAG: hypothetical protein WCF08_06395, partial [Anaerolineaceae bacterium]